MLSFKRAEQFLCLSVLPVPNKTVWHILDPYMLSGKKKKSFFSILLLNRMFKFKLILHIFCYLKTKMTILTLCRIWAWSYFSPGKKYNRKWSSTLKMWKLQCVSVCAHVCMHMVGRTGKNAHVRLKSLRTIWPKHF